MPEKKFRLVTIKAPPEIEVTVSKIPKPALEGTPLQFRIGVCVLLRFHDMITHGGSASIHSVIQQDRTDNDESPLPPTASPSDDSSSEEAEEFRKRIQEEVNNTLEFVKSEWPFEFEAAQAILPDIEAALCMVSDLPVSDTNLAFAPESSQGFARALAHSLVSGSRPILGNTKIPTDVAGLLKYVIEGGDIIDDIKSANLAASEVDFPATL